MTNATNNSILHHTAVSDPLFSILLKRRVHKLDLAVKPFS